MNLLDRLKQKNSPKRSATWRRVQQRPPWTDESAVLENCTSCGACIEACPQDIVFAGAAGTPVLKFSAGQCTFCSACAKACPEPVFRDTAEAPWDLVAALGEACLLHKGVSCRSCTDVCDEDALRFDLHVAGVGAITVDPVACTGCGACISICPVEAITLKIPAH